MTLFYVITGVASILSLLLASWALIQARRASVAAKQARDHIVIRTLADEFELTCVKLDQLLDLIQHDRLPEAAIRAHELTSALSEIPFRRSPYLDEDRKNEVLNIRTQMQIIGQVISGNRGNPLSILEKQRFIQTCQSSSVTLRENLGRIKGQLDLGAKQ